MMILMMIIVIVMLFTTIAMLFENIMLMLAMMSKYSKFLTFGPDVMRVDTDDDHTNRTEIDDNGEITIMQDGTDLI